MKKIINGKKYDTETADLMAQNYADCAVNDFNYWWEGLYRKRTGEFFLHGEGGGLSKYSRSCGTNSWTYGETIVPYTLKESQEWIAKYCGAETYEKIFGEVQE